MQGQVDREPDNTEKLGTDEAAAAPRRPRRIASLRRLLGVVVFLALIMLAGFGWFAACVLRDEKPHVADVDAIIVLTGGSHRIDEALALLADGMGTRLLISGVNPSTSRASLRRISDGDDRLFDCCVDIGYQAQNTRGNASEAGAWIKEHGYRRVLVVTSSYHLPRSLFELRSRDPDTVYIGYPVSLDISGNIWFVDARLLKLLASEYVKFIGAHLRVYLGVDWALSKWGDKGVLAT